MNRSLAALAAGALLLSATPLALADETSSSTSSSSTSSASSSSSLEKGKEWMRPCMELTGLKKAQCIVKHNPGKGNKKDRVERRAVEKALHLNSECSALEGIAKVKCLRTNGKKGIKTLIQKKSKFDREHTIRGVRVESSSSESSEN